MRAVPAGRTVRGGYGSVFRSLDEIDDPGLVDLLGWWRRACTLDGRPPSRAAFDPLDFPALLPRLFLLDADPAAHGGFRYRLAGTMVEQMLGQSLTGRDLWDVPFGEAATSIWQQYDRTITAVEPTYCEHAFVSARNRFVHYNRLLLPLRRMSDDAQMLLGAVVFAEAFDV